MKTTIQLLFVALYLLISTATTAQTWTTYQSGNMSNGVNDITIESNGSIWFTNSKGLSKFDGTTMVDVPYPPEYALTGFSKITTDINGKKWFLASFRFLFSWDNDNWAGIPINNNPNPTFNITSLKSDNNHTIWVGTTQGAFAYDINTDSWKMHEVVNNTQVWSVFTDKQNHNWIGSSNGVAEYNGVSWKTYNGTCPDGYGNVVYAITEDIQGNKWFGTEKGLFKYNGTSWPQLKKAYSGLISDTINALATDSKGNVWIGTLKGLQKFDGTTWTTYTTQNSQLINNTINAIVVDSKDNILIATPTGVSMLGTTNTTVIIPDTLIQKGIDTTLIDNTVYLQTKDTCVLNYSVPVDTFYIANTELVGNEIEFEWIFVQGSDSVFVKQSSPIANVTNGNNMVYLTIQCSQSKGSVKSNTFGALGYVDNLITTNWSVKNNKVVDVVVYPNPTSNNLNIDFGQNYTALSSYSIKILNRIGQAVYNSQISGQILNIDLSTWSGKGLYVIQILDFLRKWNKDIKNEILIN